MSPPETTQVGPARSGRFLSASWLASPGVLAVLILFVLPVGVFLFYSVLTGVNYRFSAEFPLTLDNLGKHLSSSTTRGFMVNSLLVGTLTATITVAIGLPVAYWLRYRAGRLAPVFLGLILLAFFSSYLVRVYAWRTILGENGILNSSLIEIGLLDEPLQIFLYSRFAVVLSLVYIATPIVILILYAGFRPLDEAYLQCAQDLGAGMVDRWRRVILPLLAVPIASAGLLAFIIASADYVTPQLLGAPGQSMVGVEIQTQLKTLGNYPAGAALALMVLSTYGFLYALMALYLGKKKLSKIQWQT